MWGEDGELNIPHREWLVDFNRVIDEVRSSHPDDFTGARVTPAYYSPCMHDTYSRRTDRSSTRLFDMGLRKNWNGISKTVFNSSRSSLT